VRTYTRERMCAHTLPRGPPARVRANSHYVYYPMSEREGRGWKSHLIEGDIGSEGNVCVCVCVCLNNEHSVPIDLQRKAQGKSPD
jgi:hypothetical protein